MGPSQAIILIFLYLNSCVQRQLIASDLMKIRFLAFSSSFTACFADIYIILCFHSSTFYQLEQTCLRSSMFDGHCLRLSNTGFSFARDLYFESQNLGLAFFFSPRQTNSYCEDTVCQHSQTYVICTILTVWIFLPSHIYNY